MENVFQSPVWTNRLIFISDKTFLQGDYLFDTDPDPFSTSQLVGSNTNKNVSWKLVLYHKQYNKEVENVIRMKNWSEWKSSIGFDPWVRFSNHQLRPFYNHGSPDSSDIDRDYLFSKMPDIAHAHMFSQGVTDDRNIIIIHPQLGVITEALKGYSDECNNALYHTYNLHQQSFPLLVKCKVTRMITFKAANTIRKVLGAVADYHEYRMECKTILKNKNFTDYFNFLNDKLNIEVCGSSLSDDALKTIAFQLSQTLLLFEGIESYTKSESSKHHPELTSFLYRRRQEHDYHQLNLYCRRLLSYFDRLYWHQTDDIILFSYNPDHQQVDGGHHDSSVVVNNPNNYLYHQTYCVAISITGHMVAYGIDNPFMNPKDLPSSSYPYLPITVPSSSSSSSSSTNSQGETFLVATKYEDEVVFFNPNSAKLYNRTKASSCRLKNQDNDDPESKSSGTVFDTLSKRIFDSDPTMVNKPFDWDNYYYIFRLINATTLELLASRSKITYIASCEV
eukprot:TRINITY_DN2076_c1_g1_i1.p1 TRINITY_DN2076_c1_g1~~TRINITY_DN2076_c1_g1_i1.p1  ORF type:complete len:505 (+),score=86.98 TRINITY_DN2076_c1_g1_i1:315-1829(+)